MKRLNIGCGSIKPPDWHNVDRRGPCDKYDHPVWPYMLHGAPASEMRWIPGYSTDWTQPGCYENDIRDGLGWPDEFFDMAVANHVLSDWTFHELPGALSELYRVLRPGGVLRVLVPDLKAAIEHWHMGRGSWFPQGDDLVSVDERFCTFVTWFGTVGSVFTPDYLRLVMVRAGFDAHGPFQVGMSYRGPSEITSLDGDRTTSLIMEGVK